jgi:hypothetical protein
MLTKEDVQKVIEAEGATESQITGDLLKSFAKSIKAQPIRYRLFGAYWWLIKRQLIEIDLANDEVIDLQTYKLITYGSPVLDITAAWIYYTQQLELHGLMIGNEHEPLNDSNLGAFVQDEEMESLIV